MLLRVSPPHFAGFHQHFSPQICLAFTHKPVTSHVLNIRHFFDRTQFTQHETRPWVVCHVTQLETKTPAPRTHPPCKPDDSSTDTNQRTQLVTGGWPRNHEQITRAGDNFRVQFNSIVLSVYQHTQLRVKRRKKKLNFSTRRRKNWIKLRYLRPTGVKWTQTHRLC